MPGHGSLRTRWAAIGAAIAVSLGGGITLGAHAIGGGSGGGNTYTPITPCRLMDTRGGNNTVGLRTTPLGPGDTYEATVHGTNGNCTIPSNATGIATNTTVLNGTTASFLTLYPANATRPLASNLNWTAGQAATPNQVTVGLSPDGKIRIYNDRGTVNVIIDIVGIYTDLGTKRASVSYPAQGINVRNADDNDPKVRGRLGGLEWPLVSDSWATVHMLRPDDFAGTGNVTVTVTFRKFFPESTGNIQFTVNPLNYSVGGTTSPGDPVLTNTISPAVEGWQTVTANVPADRLSQEVWALQVQRNVNVTNPNGDNLIVFAVTVEYDAYR